jgi:DNA-directed RNA polymerase specialized sigma24 family protein
LLTARHASAGSRSRNQQSHPDDVDAGVAKNRFRLDTGDPKVAGRHATRLAAFDLQQSRVVELRFFGGLTMDETAEVLHISPATVGREWAMAKAWLFAELGPTKQ